jgi:hypothetical protein
MYCVYTCVQTDVIARMQTLPAAARTTPLGQLTSDLSKLSTGLASIEKELTQVWGAGMGVRVLNALCCVRSTRRTASSSRRCRRSTSRPTARHAKSHSLLCVLIIGGMRADGETAAGVRRAKNVVQCNVMRARVGVCVFDAMCAMPGRVEVLCRGLDDRHGDVLRQHAEIRHLCRTGEHMRARVYAR